MNCTSATVEHCKPISRKWSLFKLKNKTTQHRYEVLVVCTKAKWEQTAKTFFSSFFFLAKATTPHACSTGRRGFARQKPKTDMRLVLASRRDRKHPFYVFHGVLPYINRESRWRQVTKPTRQFFLSASYAWMTTTTEIGAGRSKKKQKNVSTLKVSWKNKNTGRWLEQQVQQLHNAGLEINEHVREIKRICYSKKKQQL